MWLSSMCALWRWGSAPPRPLRRPARGRPTAARLTVELLESRDLLSGFTLGPLVQVSGPSPFNGSPYQPEFGRNAETENFVAVDPTNPQHVVTAWFQDLAIGIVSAATFDGGASWQSVVVPGLTLPSGGTFPTAADPWVTFAPNGEVYVSSVENHFFEPSVRGNAIRVNKSSDGGRTWGAPVSLIEDNSSGFNNDKSSITADPRNPNQVYAVWRHSAYDGREPRNQTMFARTTDGGRTWEPARVISVAGNDDAFTAHQVMVQPDGALVIIAEQDVRHGHSTELFVSSFRSTDGGATWSAPIQGPQMFFKAAIDPDTGQGIGEGNPDFAVDPNNGNLYAVWTDTRFLGGQYYSIAFSISTDGGRSWSAPVKINQTPTTVAPGNQQAFLPSVEVAADGTVGVTYYDLRNNTPAAGLPTDYWFIHGRPATDLTNPANWGNELRLTDTSFDMETAVSDDVKGGFFVGDYEGLAAAGNDFVPTWAMPHGTDLDSVFSRRIQALDAEAAGGPSAAFATGGGAALLAPAAGAALPGDGRLGPGTSGATLSDVFWMSDTVRMLLSTSTIPTAVGDGPSHLVLQDVNRDSKLDHVKVNSDGTIRVTLRTGDSTVGAARDVAADNLGRDGWLDLTVPNLNPDSLSVLLNDAPGQ